jgi:hypothetical protein
MPPIPVSDDFRRVLDGAALTDQLHEPSIVVRGEYTFVDENGRKAVATALRIRYSDTKPVSFEAFVRRVADELRRRGHESGNEVVYAVLGLLLALHPSGNRVRVLNEWLEQIAPAAVTQLFVFPGQARTGFDLRMREFFIGEIDLPRLLMWSEQDRADFFPRYAGELKGKFVIERGPVSVPFLPAAEFSEGVLRDRDPRVSLVYGLIENYFHVVSDALFAGFWDAFEEVQDPAIALGTPFFDDEAIRTIDGRRTISYIRGIGRHKLGLVAPSLHEGPTIDVRQHDRPMMAAFARLSREFGFDPWRPSVALDRSIASFLRFIAKARRHEAAGRRAEGFLHYVIALDLLLGGTERIGGTVATRVALLVHRGRGTTVPVEFAATKAVYDARSKYVHEGRSPEPKVATAARSLAEDVLFAALRARKTKTADFDVTRWGKLVDFLASAIDAGQAVGPDKWIEVGADDARVPDDGPVGRT